MPHDINRLHKRIEQLHERFGVFEELSTTLKHIIPRPGWTTPAEFMLVEASLESIHRQLEVAADQYRRLVEAAGQVGTSKSIAA
jgi:hypothetical protein